MQDTLFVLWPQGEAGGLKPDATLTSPRSTGRLEGRLKGRPVGRSTPGRAIRPCRLGRAPGAGGRRTVTAIVAARSIAERVPAPGRRGGAGSGFCGVEALS